MRGYDIRHMDPFESIVLATERLTIRRLSEADIPAIFGIFSHPEVMRYWSSPPYSNLAQAEEMVENTLMDYEDGRSLQMGIERSADCILIGTCTLHHFHEQCRRAELGYALGRPHWGRGYMNEALHAFVGHAFENMGLNRLEADIDPRNSASAKTLEGLGFQREGLLRERWIVEGEVSDSALYGLLRSEWMAANGRSRNESLQ